MVAKLSGIGCSSKTPTYFVSGAHGFNSAHGRMPAIATGAVAANRDLTVHRRFRRRRFAVDRPRPHVPRDPSQHADGVHHREQRRVRADQRPVLRVVRHRVEEQARRAEPHGSHRSRTLALSLGATFVARSFSGDKEQLVPILKAAFAHRGFALIDVVSPCVTFNDHEGSTKAYLYTRKHTTRGAEVDFVPPASEILATINRNRGVTRITMHDGSVLNFRELYRKDHR